MHNRQDVCRDDREFKNLVILIRDDKALHKRLIIVVGFTPKEHGKESGYDLANTLITLVTLGTYRICIGLGAYAWDV